jgi:hypothetical protein
LSGGRGALSRFNPGRLAPEGAELEALATATGFTGPEVAFALITLGGEA